MSVDTGELRCPSVFEADLPTVSYEEAPTPDEAHRRIGVARQQAPIAIGAHGPEVLRHDLVHATLRDHRLIVPRGLGLEARASHPDRCGIGPPRPS